MINTDGTSGYFIIIFFTLVLDIFTDLEDWSLQSCLTGLYFCLKIYHLPPPGAIKACSDLLLRLSARGGERGHITPTPPTAAVSRQAVPPQPGLHQSPSIWELFLSGIHAPPPFCMLTRSFLYTDPSVPSLCALHHDWHCFKAETEIVLVLTFMQQVGVVYCWAIRA